MPQEDGHGSWLRVKGPKVSQSRRLCVGAVLCLVIVHLPVAGSAEEGVGLSPISVRQSDCGYVESSEDSGPSENGKFHSVGLPADDVFRPLLADPKEPRFSGSLQRVRFRDVGETLNVGVVGFGGTFGLWGLRQVKNCNGLQINIFAAVFSQFNLDASSSDLINSDFQFGLPLTLRHGPLSARLRVFHQSSHVGDEFLLNNPDFNRVNLSFEMVEAIASLHFGWARVYGGGGYLYNRKPALDRGTLQWGLELSAPRRPSLIFGSLVEGLLFAPVFGADFRSVEQLGWNINTSLLGGLEWSRLTSTRRLRLLLSYYRGRNPYGQFFDQRIEAYGIGFYIEF
ncbi:MAG: DUF1207 domain-containing protein [Nitrospirota bacterium]|nr:DUF1207 domain-containing protein [Nitrospirota bacterium]